MDILFGIDIGGTQIKFGAFHPDGTMLEKWVVNTDLSDDGKHIIPMLDLQIRQYMSRNNNDRVALKGIGLGIPGPVDKDGYVNTCVNLNWKDFNPVEELRHFFTGVQIAAGNDANVAAFGEYTQGSGKGYESAMLITIGTGIGGGIILDGRILSGAHGLSGEIGHIAIDHTAKERCNCGNIGCIDHIASASGIVRVMKEILKDNPTECVLRNRESFSAKDICDAAKAEDELALRCLDICMEPLARGMAYYTHAFDPAVYIIGGGVSKGGEAILKPLRKHYQENLFLVSHGADIITAALGNDAGIIGAAMLVQ